MRTGRERCAGRVTRVRAAGLALGCAFATACGEGSPSEPTPPVVSSIDVSPIGRTLNWIGASHPFTAVAKDAAGNEVEGVTFTWSSSEAGVAQVDATGLATAVGTGTTTIRAAAGSVSGDATLSVTQIVATVLVSPATDTILAAGQSLELTAVAQDSSGTPVPTATMTWSTSDAAVATVDDATGLVTATGPGSVQITAHAAPVSESASLLVRNGTLIGDYVLLTDFGSTETNDYVVDDIFAVWWDPTVDDFTADAQVILDRLIEVREDALQFGWLDPPNPSFGTYVNIYLHVPGSGNDNYPDHFGNGVGTDGNHVPFMSLPTNTQAGSGFHLDHSNVRHEGAHIFQYTNSSTGYDYVGDAKWFTEASANWFAAVGLPGENVPFIAAACIPANPQLALWQGFDNYAPGDPENWQRDTRQYALNTWLHWLTTVGGQPYGVIVDGFNAGTTMLPQEYMFSQVSDLRSLFADWAAHNTADMDYLSPGQWAAAQNEIAAYGDPGDIHPYVAELAPDGTAGAWLEPPLDLLPRGWAYNVVRVEAPAATSYHFDLDGSTTGSAGAASHFEARVLVRGSDGDVIHEMTMQSAEDGALSVDVPATATDLYLVVVSVPEHFTGNQTYAYQVRIQHD